MGLLTKNIGKEFQVCRRKRKKIYSKCMLGCFMFCSFSHVISVGYVLSYGDLARMQIFFLASLYHLLSGQISRNKHSPASPSQSFWLEILRKLFVYSPFLISPEIFVHYCCFENLCLKTLSVVFLSQCNSSGWFWYLPRILLKLDYSSRSRILVAQGFCMS